MPYDIVTHQESLHCFVKESLPISDSFLQRQKRNIINLIPARLLEHCSMKNMVRFALLLTQIRTVQSSPVRLGPHNSALTELPTFCHGINAAIAPDTHAFNMSYAYYADSYMCTDQADLHAYQHSNLDKNGEVKLPDFTTIPGSFFNLPMAQAFSTMEQNPELAWDPEKKLLIIRDEVAQNDFFSKILNHLVETEKISAEDARKKEFEWRLTLAGQPLYIAPIREHSVEKRRSFKDLQKDTRAYIEENCVLETQIVNPEGRTIVETIIVKIDQWEQFLTWPDSYLRAQFNGPAISSTQSRIFDNTGFVLLLVPGIVSMSFLAPLRDWAKQRYYAAKGDEICRIVQNEALVEHAFSFIEVGDLGKVSYSGTLRGKKPFLHKPPALSKTIPVESNAIFYAANKQAGTQTELILAAKKYTDNVNQYENIVLTKQDASNYIGHRGNAPKNKAQSHDSGIRIEYDDLSETWRETLPPHMPLLSVEFQSGRTFVTIMGERYPLHMTAHNQYQVAVKYKNGESRLLPVYRDRISKSWHLKIDGEKPLFSPADESFIQQLKIEVDRTRTFEIRNNDNQAFYGDGKVIDVTSGGDTPSSFTAIEMNGEVIPVQTTSIDRHGIRYDTTSVNSMRDDSRTIVWDGDRWSLEGATSRYIAKSLKDSITPNMYASNVDIPHLSGPDQKGIRWDANQNGYLKVRNEFVQILPESHSTLLTPSGAPLSIVFRNGKYHLHKILMAEPPLSRAYNPVQPAVAQLPEASGGHDDRPTPEQADKTMKYFLENIWIESFENDDFYWKAQSYFETDDVKVEQVPSSQLQTVRTIISAKGEVAVLDISLDSKKRKILAGAELDLALSKYHERKSGNNIKHAIGLVQNLPSGNHMLTHSRVLHHTQNLIKTGSATIKGALDTLAYPPAERTLVLGNNDFLGEGSFALNACADLKTLYEALVKHVIPLSIARPNTILAPGTIYISQGIPAAIAEKHLHYQLSSRNFSVEAPIFFTAIIAPVFYNGKIVTIARKGEYLEYETAHNTTSILNLDDTLPSGKLLISKNEDAESFLKSGKCRNSQSRSIFAGKTLLSGEAALIESILRPHMANMANTNIFQNDFLIEDDKFLFIIGNEAKESHNFQPTIRKELLSTNEKSYQGTRYDWILHTSTGEMIDPKLQAVADNYLRVDSNDQSEFKSMISQRMHSLELAAGSGISMHRHDLAERK
jgi:hypothetical protein